MFNVRERDSTMIILYTSPGCASCRKAKQWLKDNQLPFVEKNIFTTMLKEDEIKYLLSRCENGTEDIISVRSKAFQQLDCDIEDLSISRLVEIVKDSPSILKRPIMISERSMVVGYDDDEITAIVPQALRNVARASCNSSCPNYPICGKVREPAQ